jgi:nucleotide-binding universal stress UspA family protein
MTAFRRIMHASDFSPASRPAFTQALHLAKVSGAELVLVHAAPSVIPVPSENLYISPETWDKIRAGARSEAQRELDELLKTAAEVGVRATSLLLEGAPAEEIVGAAEAEGVDLLVLGTHGRTGFSKFFLGSVAARVVATARCPVLTVRAGLS